MLVVGRTAFAQTVNLITRATLPSALNESSGLEVKDRDTIWSHNDSNGSPQLFCFDLTGVLLRTLTVSNATNVDWEDIAQDSAGNFYIADCGNNLNDRKDLKIYKIANPSTITGSSITAAIINFSYPEQTAFPPASSEMNFDAEAIIAFHDSIFLFTKDRSNPYHGYTYLYKLPSVPGTYSAELIDSFFTGPGPYLSYSITAADISPDYSRLILMTGDRFWLFTNFAGSDFFGGDVKELLFPSYTQKEGVCFISNTEVYISDELTAPTGGKLYYLNLQPYLTNIFLNEMEVLSIGPVPFSNELTIKGGIPPSSLITIYSMSGQVLFSENVFSSEKTFVLDERAFGDHYGFFLLELDSKSTVIRRKLLRIE